MIFCRHIIKKKRTWGQFRKGLQIPRTDWRTDGLTDRRTDGPTAWQTDGRQVQYLNLKGEFTNFFNVMIRFDSIEIELLSTLGPLSRVIVFLEAPKATITFGAAFWWYFHSNFKNVSKNYYIFSPKVVKEWHLTFR